MTANSLRSIVIRALSKLKATSQSRYGRESNTYNGTQTLEAYVKGPKKTVVRLLQKAMVEYELPQITNEDRLVIWDDSINRVEIFLSDKENNIWHIYCSGPKKKIEE